MKNKERKVREHHAAVRVTADELKYLTKIGEGFYSRGLRKLILAGMAKIKNERVKSRKQ